MGTKIIIPKITYYDRAHDLILRPAGVPYSETPTRAAELVARGFAEYATKKQTAKNTDETADTNETTDTDEPTDTKTTLILEDINGIIGDGDRSDDDSEAAGDM